MTLETNSNDAQTSTPLTQSFKTGNSTPHTSNFRSTRNRAQRSNEISADFNLENIMPSRTRQKRRAAHAAQLQQLGTAHFHAAFATSAKTDSRKHVNIMPKEPFS